MRATRCWKTPPTLLLGLLLPACMAWAQGKRETDPADAVLGKESQAVLAVLAPHDPRDSRNGLTAKQAAELLALQRELAIRLGKYCNAGACIGSKPPRPPRKDIAYLIKSGTQIFNQAHGL